MNGAFKSKLQSSKLNSSFSSFLNPGFGVFFFILFVIIPEKSKTHPTQPILPSSLVDVLRSIAGR